MGLQLEFQSSEVGRSVLNNHRLNAHTPSDPGRPDYGDSDVSPSKDIFTPDYDGADDTNPSNFPDFFTAGRGAAAAFSNNSEKRTLHDKEHEESQSYSYGEYIRAEAPSHYQKYYVQYDECKALIGHLAYVNALSKQSSSVAMLRSLSTESVPVKVHILLKQALQSLQSHVRAENPYLYTLALQIAFRDRLTQEIEKINRFVAAQYHTIEQTLRSTYRHIVQLIALDKSHHALKKEASKNASPSTVPSKPTCFGPIAGEENTVASQGQHVTEETRNDADGSGAISSPSGRSSSFSDFDTESCSDDTDDDDSSFQSAGAFTTDVGRCQSIDASTRCFVRWHSVQLRRLKRALDCQVSEIIHLDMFIRLNYKGILRLTSIFDNATASAISPWITASLKRELFANVDVDKLLVFTSLAWAKWRSAESREYLTDTDDTEKKWIPPESFVRNTTKYWVPLDQVIPLKLAILRHMPYLIFGHSTAELESFIDPFSVLVDPPAVAAHEVAEKTVTASGSSEPRPTSQLPHPSCLPATMSTINDDERGSNSSSPMGLSSPARIEEGQLVTSIYFDALDGYSYGRRIRRLEGAELVRFRWYGSNHGESNKPIFVERKTHHIRVQTGLSSTKERFSIEQKRVLDYMQGRLDLNAYVDDLAAASHKSVSDKKFQHMLTLGNAVQELLVTRQMRPMIRTSYQRSAFQLATSNEVRFSLDTNLCMVDELTKDSLDNDDAHHPQRPWCRLGEEILGKDQVVRFPYAVLEVKLQVPEQPAWVSSILVNTGAIMVYKFSKFQHGMAFLHRELVQQHGLPHWIPDFEKRGYGAGFMPPSSLGADQGATGRRRRDTVESIVVAGLSTNTDSVKEPAERSETMHGRRSGCWNLPIRNKIACWLARASSKFSGPNSLEQPANQLYSYRPLPVSPTSMEKKDAEELDKDSEKDAIVLRKRVKEATLPRKQSTCQDMVPQSTSSEGRASVNPTKLDRLTLDWAEKRIFLPRERTAQQLSSIVFSRSCNIRKLDPKSFFASERTFLHYLQKALYLSGLGLGFITLAERYPATASQGAVELGVAIATVSMALICYAYWVYVRRSAKIARRLTKMPDDSSVSLSLADEHGPFVLSITVGFTIMLLLWVNWMMSQTPFRARFSSLGTTTTTIPPLPRPITSVPDLKLPASNETSFPVPVLASSLGITASVAVGHPFLSVLLRWMPPLFGFGVV